MAKERGGAIPYIIEDGEIQMMFMKPSDPDYGGDVFQIAKGKIDKGEDIRTGSFREACEELGMFMGNVDREHHLGKFSSMSSRGSGKKMHVYVCRIKDKDMFGDPDYETGAVTWMTLDEFLEEGRDIHKPIVKAAHRWITRNEDIDEPKREVG